MAKRFICRWDLSRFTYGHETAKELLRIAQETQKLPDNIPDGFVMEEWGEAWISSTLQQLADRINEINEEKGWNEDLGSRTEGDWAALAHSEISEAFEAHREGQELFWIDEKNGNKPEGAAVEYVDTIIRILHWFKAKGINPDEVMELKLAYNKTRPYRHGGKRI